MRRVLLLSFALFGACAPAQVVTRQPDMSVVLTGERALMVLEPRLVAAGNVFQVSASPSGRYLVAFQEIPSERPLEIGKPPPEPKAKNVVVWDSLTGASRTVPVHKDVDARQSVVQWFTGTDTALIMLHFHRVELNPAGTAQVRPGQPILSWHREWHIFDTASGLLKRVFGGGQPFERTADFVLSPTEPIAVKVHSYLELNDAGVALAHRFNLQVLSADGGFGKRMELADECIKGDRRGWSLDGRTFQLEVRKAPAGGGEYVPRVLQFNPTTGRYTDVAGPVPSWSDAIKPRDLGLAKEATPVDDFPTKRAVVTWWLKSISPTETPQALVAEHATDALLPNGERFVAYVFGGALFTRQIVEIAIDKYREIHNGAVHAEILKNGKESALACLMYAADYNDVLGPGFSKNDILPYARNAAALDGFVIVFPGGNLKDVKDLANTILGYIDGPGGRAVAYLDGHVVWESKGG